MTEADPAPIAPAEEISWTCHPARRRRVAALLVAGLLAVLWTGVWLSFKDLLLTGISVLVLLSSVSPFYLPTRYLITHDSVSIRTVFGQRKKSLDLYRRIATDRHGVLLSPFDHPSRLDRFHGLNLRFDTPDRERVVAYLEYRFPRHDRQAREQA